MMEISRIEILPVKVPQKKALSTKNNSGGVYEFILTRIYTDEEITGVGECKTLPPMSPESQPVVIAIIKNFLAKQLIGEDPFNIEKIWEKMDYFAPNYPMSKATLDLALYDIMGKILGTPVYNLLGGLYRKKIPLVGLIGIGSEEAVSSDALRLVEEGYNGLKLKINPKRDINNVKAIRDSVGLDVTLRVDCNQGYSTSKAIQMIKSLERFEVELVEQPTIWWNFKALADVSNAVDTPIMPHESIVHLSDVKSLFDLGALGVLGLKMWRPLGGLTNARRLLEMGKLMGIPCLVHDDVELSVSLAAAAHFVVARYRDLEFKASLSGFPYWMDDDVVETPIKIKNGFAQVPKGPGLGVELDEKKIERYCTGIITCK
jgi:muconate cycloisomerase